MRVILLGPPGAGKGTQAKRLAQELKVAHIASGDIFRQHQEKGTALGLLAKSYMERGVLVPNEVTINMVLERISEPDCKGGCVLDGFPRNPEQARALDSALAQRREAIDAGIHIQVSDQELMRRLSGRLICRRCQAPYHREDAPPKVTGRCDLCGGELYRRDDDSPQAVGKRIEVYHKETAPLIEYFQKQGKLKAVNGEQSIEKVGQDLVRTLESMKPKGSGKALA